MARLKFIHKFHDNKDVELLEGKLFQDLIAVQILPTNEGLDSEQRI